jgi:hypothetical protein
MSATQEKLMDVVFLIDATGSMASTIRAAHNKATDIARDLRAENEDVSFAFGSVCYRDPVDAPGDIHQVHPLSEDINSLVQFLATVTASGGGDTPEDWVGAYNLALNTIRWRTGAKTIIHIADAPAHGQVYCGTQNHEEESPKLKPLIEAVAKRGILLQCLDLNSGAANSFTAIKDIYENAGGCRFKIERLSIGQSGSLEILHDGKPRRSAKCHSTAMPAPSAESEIETVLYDCAEDACEEALDIFYG